MVSTNSPESGDRDARRRWLRHEAINLGDVIVQIFAVVVGILLALFINNWSTQRQRQATVNDALQAIRAELVQNQAQMHQHYLRLHSEGLLMLKEAKTTQAPRPCTAYGAWRGYGSPLLLTSAYQTAIADQALAEMPFAQAERIAQIYGSQQNEQKLEANDASYILFSGRAEDESDCIVAINEMAAGAHRLDEAYAKSVKMIAAPAAPVQP